MLLALFAAIALANAANWRIIDSNVLTTDLGMYFASFLCCGISDRAHGSGVAFTTETLGYTAGDVNGKGPAILKSTDGTASFLFLFVNYGLSFLLPCIWGLFQG
jgi:hypothetical protein